MNIFSKKLLISGGEIYEPNEVILDLTVAQTVDLKIKQDGIYLVEMVGSGGGGAYIAYYRDSKNTKKAYVCTTGSGGGVFRGEIQLDKNIYECRLGSKGASRTSYPTYYSYSTNGKTISGTSATSTYFKIKNNTNKLIEVGGGQGSSCTKEYAYVIETINPVGGAVTLNISPITTINNKQGDTSAQSSNSRIITYVGGYGANGRSSYGDPGEITQSTVGLFRITYLRKN